ncbi:Hypothetical protein DPCES_1436 [Desulfitobacterium hafniense]|uniref:Uncharacterized protein n=1 Tax=Desulfitobacterium hafniense TaxID=49338 RepID=A0A098AXI2_DESHA|nr:hypothetical protein [Desulfitobacterium hafniense]CDX01323.1 Hypothetical protein DPCES_1436 [Desulfitobacterium hafniense]
MTNTIAFETITDILSEELYQTRYIIGKVDSKHYIYIWSTRLSGEFVEINQNMLTSPTHDHGAMIGTADEIRWEVENCVGFHRESEDEVTREAAEEVVEELLGALE